MPRHKPFCVVASWRIVRPHDLSPTKLSQDLRVATEEIGNSCGGEVLRHCGTLLRPGRRPVAQTRRSAVTRSGASIAGDVTDPTEAEAKKQFQIYAGFKGEKQVGGVGDEPVMADHAGLSALTARKGALFVHLEESGEGATAKPLVDIAKSVIAKGKA